MLRPMHFTLLSLLGLAATTARAQTLNTEPPTASRAAILRVLVEPVKFRYEETPLEEVVADISHRYDVDMYIDTKALDEVGIDSDTPVTCRVRKISLASALDHLLHNIDPSTTWTIFDDRLTITTREWEEERQETVTYDVWALTPDGDFDSLIKLITRTIEPQCWDEVGGSGAVAQYHAPGIRVLVVTQTLEVHRQVDTLLVNLHQLGGHPVRPAPALRYGTPYFARVPGTRSKQTYDRSSVSNPRNIPMTRARSTRLRTDRSGTRHSH